MTETALTMSTTTKGHSSGGELVEQGRLTSQQQQSLQRAVKRLDALAHLMDDRFEIPIIRVRIGLDPIIGMIPGGGDWVVWLVGIYIFWEAVKLGAPMHVLMRMATNIGVDLLGGYAPVAGDIFDVFYRSNKRNVELLRGYLGAKPELDAPLPSVLPTRVENALVKGGKNKVVRYGFAALASVLLLLLASGPTLLIYWLIQSW